MRDSEVAINDPATRSALRRYTRNAIGLVLLAVVLLAATWMIGSAGHGLREIPSSRWSNAPALTILPVAAFLAFIVGAGGLLNCTRIRRALSRHSWKRKQVDYQVRSTETGYGRVKSSFISLDVDGERVSFAVVRPFRSKTFDLPELDFAGTSDSGVITDPKHSVLALVGQRKRAEKSLVRDRVVDPGNPVEKYQDNDARLRIHREG